MKPILLVSLGMFFLAGEIGGQPIQPPKNVVCIPSTFYVGDKVTLRFTVESRKGTELKVPEELPKLSWGVVHLIQVSSSEQKDKHEVSISFTPYRTGTQRMPPLKLGLVTVEDIQVSISSLLDTAKEIPAPLREQMVIPNTTLVLALGIGGVFSLLILYLLWIRWGYPWIQNWWERHQRRKPYKQLIKDLEALKEQRGDPRQFYVHLLDSVRLYLSQRWNPCMMAYTTTELEMNLFRDWGSEETVASLLGIFKKGDRVKFGGKNVDTESLPKDLHLIQTCMTEIENYFLGKEKTRKGSHDHV
ncbi:MAG TPA: heme biosynthesis HemY N-terminal domain-containing protein [Spirochaetales bacterium]|nr:heme biosynthesis HemY N-terminal domain-containing protein [Spirochaetales bacterium]